MHTYSIYLIGIIIVFFTSCDTVDHDQHKKTTSVADTAKYYPVDGFIQEQIRFVELRDFTINKTTTIGSTAINTILQKKDFVREVQIVENAVIQFTKNKHLFKETVFQDLGTESYTINYTAIEPSFPIQRIDVLLNEQTNIIKRLFVREINQTKDTLLTRQYSWEADHRFQISTSKESAGTSHTATVNVQWNKPSGK